MPGIITCQFLSTQRIGNAFFIFCFARAYARAMHCELQLPEAWIGRRILVGVDEPLISVSLPATPLDSESREPVGIWFGKKNVELRSYFQNQKSIDWFTRSDVLQWIRFKPDFERYAVNYGTYSAAHIRRGDYTTPPLNKLYCEVSDESYDRAIEQFQIPKPVFRVQEGWRAPHPELQKQGIGWLQDFLFLRDAAHLLRANSSFSVFAGWLGNGKVYSPLVEDKAGLQTVPFVLGNHPCTAGRFQNQSDLKLKEI